MCGIAGIWTVESNECRGVQLNALRNHRGTNGDIDLEKTTQHMIDTLIHRGPDDQGVWVDKEVAFGHRRLKVIDLEGGKQPMTDPEERIWLVFNGEIYNYRELRNQLMQLGHIFRTRSDTEVLLHAYLEWDLSCLERLEGMFAFAVWDRRNRKLHLVRDRLGIKPLFWTRQGDHVYFASEIKAILTVPGFRRQVNTTTLIYYLSHYQSVMGDATLFQGIQSVEPATVVTFTQPCCSIAPRGRFPRRQVVAPECGQVPSPDRITQPNENQGDGKNPEISRYWSFPIIPSQEQEDRGEGYYQAKVRDLLTRSVERQLISDVPIGAYLSGGLDSTILVGLMAELGVKSIKTYSIGFDDPPLNEFPFSQLVSRIFGTNHTEIGINARDYFPAMEELIRFKDTPLSVPNEVPLFLMSKILKNDITVVLSGEGADELFGGYAAILRTPMDFRNLKAANGQEKQEFLKKLSSFYGSMDFDDEVSHFQAAYCWLTPQELNHLLLPEISQGWKRNDPMKDFWAQKFQPLRQLLPEDRILNLLETVHLSGLLARLDTTTMAASVEGRVPFTDTALMEFAAGIPLEYKLRWRSPGHQKLAQKAHCWEIAEHLDIPKYILKKSFQDIVPEAILTRPKASFPVPLDAWFQGQYRTLAWRTISQSKLMPELFNMTEVERWFQSHPGRTPNYGLKVWMLMNVALWLDTYFT
jgi:asparagine synthase (glutamine-hydrolysing)